MFFSRLSEFYNKKRESIQAFFQNQILLNIVFTYSKFIVLVDNYKKTVFNQYPILKKWEEKSIKILNILYSKYQNKKSEPFYDNWISISKMIVYDDVMNSLYFKYNIEEEYKIIKYENPEFYDSNSLIIEMNENTNIKECLIISKYNNKYNCFVQNKLSLKYCEIRKETCKNPFLSIEYRHKMMKNPISINLDKGYFLVGNEILSKSFILRYLEYNTEKTYYDSDYEIHIIDNNINNVILKSTEYILLEKNNYFVKQNYFVVVKNIDET